MEQEDKNLAAKVLVPSGSPVLSGGLGNLLKVYQDWRMAKIILLGIISGFPWVLIASMMSLWLRSVDVSKTGIGLFGILFTVYAVNMFWAPIVDSFKLPVLWRLGQRRSWILLMQAFIATLMVLMFFADPRNNIEFVALLAFLIALCSATQDVAVDALRIELINRDEPNKVGAGSAMATSGWWIGFGGFGALGLVLAEFFEMTVGLERYWQSAYLSLVPVIVLCVVLVLLFIKEPDRIEVSNSNNLDSPRESLVKRFGQIWLKPIMSFVTNYGLRVGILILCLVFFFKIGEAFLGRMSIIFYREIEFSKSDIALYSKGFGTLALIAFTIIGSLINARYGLLRGLIIGGIAMASTNLLFAVLAFYPETWLFAFAVITDQFTTAMSTVALVAFLSQLCDRAYTATQYAALASIGNLARTSLAAGSGYMVDQLGGNWSLFFVITTLMVIPSLLLLLYIRKDLIPIMTGKTTKFI